MLKNIFIIILTICLLANFQSCCTMIGYSVGKSMDLKNYKEANFLTTDSLHVVQDSTSQNLNNSETNFSTYRTLLTIAGIAADVSFLVIAMLLINPIQINMGRF